MKRNNFNVTGFGVGFFVGVITPFVWPFILGFAVLAGIVALFLVAMVKGNKLSNYDIVDMLIESKSCGNDKCMYNDCNECGAYYGSFVKECKDRV